MNTTGRRAVITGVYGQDGSYLAELLLRKGYEVRGIVRAEECDHPIGGLLRENELFSTSFLDITDTEALMGVVRPFQPDEVYNLAAVSDLKTAEEKPGLTYDINFRAFHVSAHIMYDADPSVRIFQALSSRILVPNERGVITEHSILKEGENMYDKAKRDSYGKTILPLRKKGCFISSGFLCNHESPRRGERFVTGKIAKTVARIARGEVEFLEIGNVEALRDWSHAEDVVSGIHAILGADEPGDYIIGSGELHSVREFINEAFRVVGMSLIWSGAGTEATARDESGKLRVQVNPTFFRPDDNPVVSDTARLEERTDWRRKYSFSELVHSMVEAELVAIQT
jgi:GDPmannose 4,6-dehydratase